MIDLKKLRSLVEMMAEHGLTEVDLEDGSEKVKLRRGPSGQMVVEAPSMPQPMVVPQAVPAPAAAASEPAAAPAAEPTGKTIDSPMVGTFYAAATPDADPFVKAGDSVSASTVVCIIEAMKVFNEIKAEQGGTIAEVLVSNGDAVEFGQPLFRLKG